MRMNVVTWLLLLWCKISTINNIWSLHNLLMCIKKSFFISTVTLWNNLVFNCSLLVGPPVAGSGSSSLWNTDLSWWTGPYSDWRDWHIAGTFTRRGDYSPSSKYVQYPYQAFVLKSMALSPHILDHGPACIAWLVWYSLYSFLLGLKGHFTE